MLSREIRYEPKVTRAELAYVAIASLLVFGVAWAFTRGAPAREAVGPFFIAAVVASVLFGFVTFRQSRRVVVTSERIRVEVSSDGGGRRRTYTVFDVRWAEAGPITEVCERAAGDEGERVRNHLRIGSFTIRDGDLGAEGRTGLYAELVDAVRAAVGERMTTREVRGRAP